MNTASKETYKAVVEQYIFNFPDKLISKDGGFNKKHFYSWYKAVQMQLPYGVFKEELMIEVVLELKNRGL